MAKINWTKAKRYYLSDEEVSYANVAERFGVSETAVKERPHGEGAKLCFAFFSLRSKATPIRSGFSSPVRSPKKAGFTDLFLRCDPKETPNELFLLSLE